MVQIGGGIGLFYDATRRYVSVGHCNQIHNETPVMQQFRGRRNVRLCACLPYVHATMDRLKFVRLRGSCKQMICRAACVESFHALSQTGRQSSFPRSCCDSGWRISGRSTYEIPTLSSTLSGFDSGSASFELYIYEWRALLGRLQHISSLNNRHAHSVN